MLSYNYLRVNFLSQSKISIKGIKGVKNKMMIMTSSQMFLINPGQFSALELP